MRDPERIEEILELLRSVWLKNPDLRLAQLLMIASDTADEAPALFYLEDATLRRRLERLLASAPVARESRDG